MAPRRLLVLGVLLCALVLISSRVDAAAEATAASNVEEQKKRDPIEESKACPHGCQLFYKGHCWICKPPPKGNAAVDAADAVGDSKQVHGCARGCCSWFRGRCVRCCRASETAADAVGDSKQVHGCARGCCSWFRERCVRCCRASETAADATVVHP